MHYPIICKISLWNYLWNQSLIFCWLGQLRGKSSRMSSLRWRNSDISLSSELPATMPQSILNRINFKRYVHIGNMGASVCLLRQLIKWRKTTICVFIIRCFWNVITLFYNSNVLPIQQPVVLSRHTDKLHKWNNETLPKVRYTIFP